MSLNSSTTKLRHLTWNSFCQKSVGSVTNRGKLISAWTRGKMAFDSFCAWCSPRRWRGPAVARIRRLVYPPARRNKLAGQARGKVSNEREAPALYRSHDFVGSLSYLRIEFAKTSPPPSYFDVRSPHWVCYTVLLSLFSFHSYGELLWY